METLTFFSTINGTRQNMSKDMEKLVPTISKQDLMNIYKTFCITKADTGFFYVSKEHAPR